MSEKIVQLNEEVIKGQIRELARGSVEESLNEMMEKEAEQLTQDYNHLKHLKIIAKTALGTFWEQSPKILGTFWEQRWLKRTI